MRKIFIGFLAIIAGSMLGSCTDHNQEPDPTAKTYVLVHGAWQAPFAWDIVKAQLENQGHHVLVVGLPAHGDDFTPPQDVTMDVYRDKVVETINSVNGKVILVGHSLAGMVITATAEKIPNRIEKLIYIAGYIPKSGQTLIELANMDTESSVNAALRLSADSLTLDIVHESITDIFLQDGSQQSKDLLLSKYRVEPAIPYFNPVTITDGNFGKVDKYYIHTAFDHVNGPLLQKQMVAAAGITKEYYLQSSHSPFLSMPDKVTELLMSIGKL